MDVTRALYERRSIRAFTPAPVPESEVRAVLDAARWSPSGGNLQPWRVIAVAGTERSAVIDACNTAAQVDGSSQEGDNPMYPASLWEPYRTRRYEVGEAMYEKLGIDRGDMSARIARVLRNFDFFDAPVGLFFITDDRFGRGQWAHLGMFMQSIALAAVDRGLATCMQEAWAMRRNTLKEHFALEEHDYVYCGMALGYPDPNDPVNTLRTSRASVDEIADFRGF